MRPESTLQERDGVLVGLTACPSRPDTTASTDPGTTRTTPTTTPTPPATTVVTSPPTTPPEYVPSTYQAEIGVFKAAPGLMRACGVYGSRPRWFGAG